MECKICGKSININKSYWKNKRWQYFCSQACYDKSLRSKFFCAICRKVYIEHYKYTCNEKNKCPKCGVRVSLSAEYYQNPSDMESQINELLMRECLQTHTIDELRKKHGVKILK